jgi:threonine synthase
MRSAKRLDAICDDAFAVTPPLRRFGTDGRLRAGTVPRPHRRVQGLRRAPSWPAAWAHCHAATATPLTIVVATSGDTGAAVGAAFHRKPGFRVVILYPDGRVSPRQAHQLGCFGDNVRALRVAGSFDDCQALVKSRAQRRRLHAQRCR